MSEAAASEFTPDELEAGRRLFASEWRFLSGAGSVESLPEMQGIEVAFAGRSNVGKSSLLNAITSRKALARVSDTPGRTREINFFARDGDLVLADLPGYGYARAPRTKIREWTGLVDAYLAGRANLVRVFVLIDARHGLKEADTEILNLLGRAAVSHAIVLTKTDRLKAAELEAGIADTAAAIARRAAAFPIVFATSSLTGAGLPELRAAIARLAAERSGRD